MEASPAPWFSGKSALVTYSLEELLATKLRALYQRKKGRDLFDLWYALTQTNVSKEKVITAWKEYLRMEGNSISRKQFLSNLAKKMDDSEFARDLAGLLLPAVRYDSRIAHEIIISQLIERI